MFDVKNFTFEKVQTNDPDFYPHLYYFFSFGDKSLYVKKVRSGYAVVGIGIGIPVIVQSGCDIYYQFSELRPAVERFREMIYLLMKAYHDGVRKDELPL